MLLFIVFAVILNKFQCSNTSPVSWNYQPNLIECGTYTINSPSTNISSNLYSPSTFIILFKRLKNPNTQYQTLMVGFVDFDNFNAGPSNRSIEMNYYSVAISTNITLTVFSTNQLNRLAINYMAFSYNFTTFFVCSYLGQKSTNAQFNNTNPQNYTLQSVPRKLPAITNIRTVISITSISVRIIDSTNLFNLKLTVQIVDLMHYNLILSSNLARTYINYIKYCIMFYQQLPIAYSNIYIFTTKSWSTITNDTYQIVSSNDLINDFEVNSDNSFFGLSEIASLSKVDFTISYTSTFSIQVSINLSKNFGGSLFVYRQSPTCPNGYFLSHTQPLCVCGNPSCYEGIGCISVIAGQNSSSCSFCSIFDNFQLDSQNNCICKVGFNLVNSTCQQICGDGIKFKDECDDGNAISGDGCSSTCQIQNNFKCYQNSNGVSVCMYQLNICFNITNIYKNVDNSAVFTFQVLQNYYPFSFDLNDFEAQNTLNLTIQRNSSMNVPINYQITQAFGQTIEVTVYFNQTIEGLKGTIIFNFSNSKYLSSDCTLNFVCKGSQLPLVFSLYTQQYQIIQKINIFYLICLIIILILGMFAPKWIGIELLQVAQLIYFSQLLITEDNNWPASFSVFLYFKYVNGLNNIFSNQITNAISTDSKKWLYLGFQPLFILNYFFNFALISILALVYLIFKLFNYKKDKVKQLLNSKAQNNQSKENNNKLSNNKYTVIQRKLYQILINVMVWSTLQLLASFVCQIQLLEYPFNTYNFIIPIQANTLISIVCLIQLFIICGNLFFNIFLSQQAIEELQLKPELQTYKKVNVSYHYFLGILIFCLNKYSIKGIIPVSLLLFFGELTYIIYLYKLKPYQKCLKIHFIGLIANRLVILGFLVFVTFKNFVVDINEDIMLAMCYFIVGGIFITICLSFVRLYYDLRYGQQIEKTLQEVRKKQELQRQKLKKLKETYLLRQIRQNALKKKKKIDQIQKKGNLNQYLYQNIKLEEEKLELLQFLQKNINMTKIQKQRRYFQKYTEKPLKWLKNHDKQLYKKKVREKQEQKKKTQQKRNKEEKQQHEEYIKQMKKQYYEKQNLRKRKNKH